MGVTVPALVGVGATCLAVALPEQRRGFLAAAVLCGFLVLAMLAWAAWDWFRERRRTRSTAAPAEAEQIREVRRLAGELAERVGDYGAPLREEEDERYRQKWAAVRDAAGSFAHHPELRQALRDFENRFGWMMRYKSDGTHRGRRQFDSAQEEAEARRELEEAYQALVRACNALL